MLLASLLAVSVAVAIILGPWAANWALAGLFLASGAVLGYLGFARRRGALLALAIGFAALGAATAFRTLGGSHAALLSILYAVAGLGTVGSFVLEGKRTAC